MHEAILLYQHPVLAGNEARTDVFLRAGQLQVLQYLPRARELHYAERRIPALEQQHAADDRGLDDVIHLKALQREAEALRDGHVLLTLLVRLGLQAVYPAALPDIGEYIRPLCQIYSPSSPRE